jgi:hypothetical protein
MLLKRHRVGCGDRHLGGRLHRRQPEGQRLEGPLVHPEPLVHRQVLAIIQVQLRGTPCLFGHEGITGLDRVVFLVWHRAPGASRGGILPPGKQRHEWAARAFRMRSGWHRLRAVLEARPLSPVSVCFERVPQGSHRPVGKSWDPPGLRGSHGKGGSRGRRGREMG